VAGGFGLAVVSVQITGKQIGSSDGDVVVG
jgi:hypothetical protein